MKVHTIEIASAIEQELKTFLKDWGGAYPMRFTRFIDLGGRQTDLHVYPAKKDAPAWMVVRIKSVMKSEQGECIQIFVSLTGSGKAMEEVLVSPEVWKLPALADRVLTFSKNEMLSKLGEGAEALEGGSSGGSLESGSGAEADRPENVEEEDEDDYENIDTSGILAGDGDDSGDIGFNPEDVIAGANAESGDEEQVEDPSELLRQLAEEEPSEESEGEAASEESEDDEEGADEAKDGDGERS